MSRDQRRGPGDGDASAPAGAPARAPGKSTRTQRLPAVQHRRTGAEPSGGSSDGPVQFSSSSSHDDPFGLHLAGGDPPSRSDSVRAAAAEGLRDPSVALPHLDRIQTAFGRHDVSHVEAHVGGAAQQANESMGATAYATGDHVAFAATPDLHTAAHEAAHVVQQRAGVHLKGGVGEEGDAYERHADAVADKVVMGESAEELLGAVAPMPAGDGGAAVQHRKRGRGAPPAKASNVESAAHDVAEAAALAAYALGNQANAEGPLARLDAALQALGRALHETAGDRPETEEKALRTALQAARRVPHEMSRRDGPRGDREVALSRRIDALEDQAFAERGGARGPSDLTPQELEAQALQSLVQLEAARDLAVTLGISASALERTIEKTDGWRETLGAPDATAADARRLSGAVFQQQEVLFDLAAELQDVTTQASPSNHEIVEAYIAAMARSTEQRSIVQPFVERARRARRARPLARAGASLAADNQTTLEITELDADAGKRARAEHRAIGRKRAGLSKALDKGRPVSDLELRRVEVDSRELAVRHHTQLLELQARQLASALGELGGSLVNRFDLELAGLRTDLLSLAEEFPIVRQRYERAVDESEAEHGASADGVWNILRAREKGLDELEQQLQRYLAKSDFLDTLRRATKKAENAQVRLFAQQLFTTVALTLAGNLAASAARGAAEGAWVARASRAGATDAEAGMVAAQARTVGAAAGFAADVAVNTIGQKLQGDGASLVTLLALNVVSPLVIGKIQGKFTALEKVNATASRWKRAGSAIVHFTYDKLELAIEMIAGAAVDYASRVLMGIDTVDPTDQEATEWLLQGASMAIGRHLAVRSRTIASKLQRIEAQTRHSMHALVERSRALEGQSHELAGRPDPELAVKLLETYQHLLADGAEHQAGASDDADGPAKTSRVEAPGRRDDDWDEGMDRPKQSGRRRRKDPPEDDGGAGNRGEPYADWREGSNELGPKQYIPKRQLDRFASLKRRNTWAEIAAAKPDDLSSVIGTLLPTADAGHNVLERLARGDVSALSAVGIHDYPPDYDSTGREWALIEVREGFALMAGSFDAVELPVNVRVLGHTHPSRKPSVPYDGAAKPELAVSDAQKGDRFTDLLSDPTNVKNSGLSPSAKDLHNISDGTPHVLYTRFVHTGDGRVLPPDPGDTRPRVQVHLTDTRVLRWNPRTGEYWYRTHMSVKDANGAPIWSGSIYMQWARPVQDGTVHFSRPAVLDRTLAPGWRQP